VQAVSHRVEGIEVGDRAIWVEGFGKRRFAILGGDNKQAIYNTKGQVIATLMYDGDQTILRNTKQDADEHAPALIDRKLEELAFHVDIRNRLHVHGLIRSAMVIQDADEALYQVRNVITRPGQAGKKEGVRAVFVPATKTKGDTTEQRGIVAIERTWKDEKTDLGRYEPITTFEMGGVDGLTLEEIELLEQMLEKTDALLQAEKNEDDDGPRVLQDALREIVSEARNAQSNDEAGSAWFHLARQTALRAIEALAKLDDEERAKRNADDALSAIRVMAGELDSMLPSTGPTLPGPAGDYEARAKLESILEPLKVSLADIANDDDDPEAETMGQLMHRAKVFVEGEAVFGEVDRRIKNGEATERDRQALHYLIERLIYGTQEESLRRKGTEWMKEVKRRFEALPEGDKKTVPLTLLDICPSSP